MKPKRLLWMLAAAVCLYHCDADSHGAAGSRQAPACVIALSPQGELTVRQARGVRTLIVPAPTKEESRRLAFDAFVADARAHGEPRPGARVREHLEAYGKLQEQFQETSHTPLEQAERVSRELKAAKQRFHIEYGPCHPERQGSR